MAALRSGIGHVGKRDSVQCNSSGCNPLSQINYLFNALRNPASLRLPKSGKFLLS
jgi:hypothetical protein